MIKQQHALILAILAIILTSSLFYLKTKNKISRNTITPHTTEKNIILELAQNQDGSFTYNGEYFSVNFFENLTPLNEIDIENNYERLELYPTPQKNDILIDESKVSFSVKKVSQTETIDSFIKYLHELKESYKINKSGVLNNITEINFNGIKAVRYQIHVNLPEIEKFEEIDTIYFIKDNKGYLLRLASYGIDSQKLKEVVQRDSLIFNNILKTFEIN